ncbi:MAG: HdeD family acid-resistance protein [Actinobacteria bacterium]|nr:MAG: HdeD family acid-resistance protein [Actinomycetota bacterium]
MQTEQQAMMSRSWGWMLVQGLATLIIGFFLITATAATLLVLVTFIGFYWLVRGIIDLVAMFTPEGRAHWGWLLFVGLLGVFAGLIVLRHPLYSSALAPTVLAIILGIDGLIMGFANIFRSSAGDGFGAFVLGILDIIIGAILIANPFIAGAILPFILGFFAIIGGIVLIINAFRYRKMRKMTAVPEEKKAA